MNEVEEKKSNGLAVTSLVLGCIGLCCLGPLTGFPAIILGIIALVKGQNQGYSIGGIATGVASTFTVFVIMILAAMLLPSLGSVKDKANIAACMANMNALGKGMLLYADDYDDGRYPDSFDSLINAQYAEEGLLHCKLKNNGERYEYMTGINANSDSDIVIIHCNHGDHSKYGSNVLLVGGSARHIRKTEPEPVLGERLEK